MALSNYFQKQPTFEEHSEKVNKTLTNPAVSLHPHQLEALIALKEHEPQTSLLILPTGTGKTGVVALAPYVLGSNKTLIITPSEIISNQIHDAMHGGNKPSFYEKIGLINHEILPAFRPTTYIVNTSDVLERRISQSDLVITNAHKFGTNSSIDLEKLPNNVFDLVIVDEAHHYPAPTWQAILQHFSSSKRVFLTATPFNNGKNILADQDYYTAYKLTHDIAVERGIIRRVRFHEDQSDQEGQIYRSVVEQMIAYLDEHDVADERVKHQGMILARTTEEVDEIFAVINQLGDSAAAYYGGKGERDFSKFKKGNKRFLVVCGKCLEGFDQNRISVLGILRKVQSKVLFAQFLGRCVRRIDQDDNITAHVVSHEYYQQKGMFDDLDRLAQVDPTDREI